MIRYTPACSTQKQLQIPAAIRCCCFRGAGRHTRYTFRVLVTCRQQAALMNRVCAASAPGTQACCGPTSAAPRAPQASRSLSSKQPDSLLAYPPKVGPTLAPQAGQARPSDCRTPLAQAGHVAMHPHGAKAISLRATPQEQQGRPSEEPWRDSTRRSAAPSASPSAAGRVWMG